MATDAAPAIEDHPFHLPPHLASEPKVGTHVLLFEHGTSRDALIQVVFPEHGMPALTLVLIKSGNRGIQTKVLVPHKSKCCGNSPYWCLTTELDK